MKKREINILLVDDKQANLFALEQLLAQKERSFFKATNGKEALKLAYNQEVDLIILDVHMPEMDGFEVAQLLKSNKRTREIPIIFATAEKKEQKSIVRGMEEGAVDYLFKPLDPEITRAKVDVLLKIHLQKKELKEKNAILEKYEILINNCADLICTLDAETLRFEELNAAFTKLLGYRTDELKNTSLLLYVCDETRLLLEKIRNTSDVLSFESGFYSSTGEQKWLQWNIIVKNGKWYANARDITEIKQAEELKNYLATVVKQSFDAIYLLSIEGKIISWNKGAETIYGYNEEEALQMFVGDIIPEQLLEEGKKAINKVMQGESIPLMESQRLTKQGKLIDVFFSASSLPDGNNNVKSVAITERDITAQKLSENKINELNLQLQRNIFQLQITNADLESFSYTVSHDLRAPLRAINSYSRILLTEHTETLEEEPNRLLKKIESNARKMGSLIDDLLEFSKLGGRRLAKTRFSMKGLSEKVVKECCSTGNLIPDIKILDLPEANGDYSLLNQVMVNLISNAIKYSAKKKNPRIEIGGVEKDAELEYYVKDNGAGFNKNYEDKLFKVFQRLHTEDEFEGTGVGLAIVKRIIEKHEGKVWAEGKTGIGATFYFSIPK